MEAINPDPLLTYEQAATYLNVKEDFLRDLVKTRRIESELGQTWRVRRALFGEEAFLPHPEHAGWPGPACREPQREAERRRLGAGRGGTELMQRLGGHDGG